MEALERHRPAQNAERLRLGALWEDHGLVFPAHTGKPMRAYSLTGGPYLRLLKRAGFVRPRERTSVRWIAQKA